MIELMHAILTLGIVVIGFGVMLGRISISDAIVKIAVLAAALFLVISAVQYAQATWHSWSDQTRAAAVLLVLFVVVPLLILRFVLKTRLGHEVLIHLLADWIKDRLRGK